MIVIEREGRLVGVGRASGVWVKAGCGRWRCLASPRDVSGALQAIDFLTQGYT